MAALYVWSPKLVDARVVEVLVTRGDISGIANGTVEFADTLLETLSVTAEVSTWRVSAFRTRYFSEYIGEEDWRDTWQPVWRVRIETSSPIAGIPELAEEGVGTDVGDDSWTPENRLRDDDDVKCLVIADFATGTTLAYAKSLVGNLFESPDFREVTIADGIQQLQIEAGPFPAHFFAEGAGLAEQVVEACQALGGTVHFQQRPR